MSWLELLVASAAVLAADQLSERRVLMEPRFAVARRRFVSIHCILNRRAAIISLSETGIMAAWILCAALALFALEQEPLAASPLAVVGVGLALGGVSGNVVDLLWRGGIVDFIAIGSRRFFQSGRRGDRLRPGPHDLCLGVDNAANPVRLARLRRPCLPGDVVLRSAGFDISHHLCGQSLGLNADKVVVRAVRYVILHRTALRPVRNPPARFVGRARRPVSGSGPGQQGCVALIVRALQKAGMTFDRAPPDMMPADLAKHFGILP